MCQFVFVQTDKKSNTLVNLVLLICLFLVLSFLSKDNVPDIAVHFGKSLSLSPSLVRSLLQISNL